jgi:hypothetical protein
MKHNYLKNGGEAFPSHPQADIQYNFIAHGMSLRDYFAAKALQGLLANPDKAWVESVYAKFAYKLADAMLESRE